jgi:hypothetical protein
LFSFIRECSLPVELSRYNDGVRAERPALDSWQGKRFFSLLHRVQIDSQDHQMGAGGRVKRLEREADLSPPPSAEVKWYIVN